MLKKLYDLFEASTHPSSLGNRFRQRRMAVFKGIIDRLPKPLNILDVGGNEDFWLNAGLQNRGDIQITLLNLTRSNPDSFNMKSVVGDATDMGNYGDSSYDIVFSNSVIEHLYTEENQMKMAKECVRVGKYHFVQTPNKYFFIEPHYLLPYFQFVPKGLKYSILTETKLSRLKYWDKAFAKSYVDEIRLLSLKDMRKLFPKSKIWKEKFLFMNKSFVAHNVPME